LFKRDATSHVSQWFAPHSFLMLQMAWRITLCRILRSRGLEELIDPFRGIFFHSPRIIWMWGLCRRKVSLPEQHDMLENLLSLVVNAGVIDRECVCILVPTCVSLPHNLSRVAFTYMYLPSTWCKEKSRTFHNELLNTFCSIGSNNFTWNLPQWV